MAKKKKKKGKKAARRSAPRMEMLLVGSKTKAAMKSMGVNVAGDALDGLNMVVHWYIQQATQRAGANGRKTVRAHDIILG